MAAQVAAESRFRTLARIEHFRRARPSSSCRRAERIAYAHSSRHSPDAFDAVEVELAKAALLPRGRSEIRIVNRFPSRPSSHTFDLVKEKIPLCGKRVDVGRQHESAGAKRPPNLL